MIKWILHVELRSLINDADEEERIKRRKDNSRVLVEQPPHIDVATPRNISVIVDLAGLIAAGRQADRYDDAYSDDAWLAERRLALRAPAARIAVLLGRGPMCGAARR